MTPQTARMISTLEKLGITWADAIALRRISMTLRRWYTLECNGDISRDLSDQPYRHYGRGTVGPFQTVRCPDKETAARKRLADIMARYPTLGFYIQGDPRGAALYILRPGDVPAGQDADAYYSRGVAVFK